MPTRIILRPRSPNEVPPGGNWVYVDPDSGYSFRHPYLSNVKSNARQHRKVSNFPIGGNWDEEFLQNVCTHTPGNPCDDTNPNKIDTNATLTLGDIVRGTEVILALKVFGTPLVELDEAKRRAAICVQCPYNVKYHKPCATKVCEALVKVVRQLVGGATTGYEDRLNACAVCKCDNSAQAHVPLELLRKGITEEMDDIWPTEEKGFTINCWKRKEV